MNIDTSSEKSWTWQQQAHQYLLKGDYKQAVSVYEEAIEAEPEVKSHYWYLGLMLLLQEQLEEAHTTWLLGMVEGEPEQVDHWTRELIEVLETEAQRRESLEETFLVWLIRGQIQEINPTDLNNLFRLIQGSIQEQRFTGDDLKDWGVIELLQDKSQVDVDSTLLLQTLRLVLEEVPFHTAALEFVEAALGYCEKPSSVLSIVLPISLNLAYTQHRSDVAAQLAEAYWRFDPKNLENLRHLTAFYEKNCQYQKSIETSKECYSLAENLLDKIFADHLIIRCLMSAGGATTEALSAFHNQKSLLLSLIKDSSQKFSFIEVSRLFNSYFFAPYILDDPRENRPIQNQVAQLGQTNFEKNLTAQSPTFPNLLQRQTLNLQKSSQIKPLRIGYLSSCFKEHSVGWLARWLLHYQDRNRFYPIGYFTNQDRQGSPLEEWYVRHFAEAHYTISSLKMADQIRKDEIDILIDLDSITLDISCEIMAQKPAPVQATWLGWDASGIPAIDYFIADPYVLPESAQDYYREKIWRLPETYIAVDGFEVGVPTLRRDLLGIPNDAVLYFSGQRGYKRHPHTAQLQMKILKEVPNSYFLVKGLADPDAIKSFFTQLAEQEGVDPKRVIFLPRDNSEAIHRANLGIADVVLDTYPYNGATTTLETLWMGIPLVTRVGEQFAARNSYTMMMNVGVTEGIAWTDEEYVEWGIRLGTDSCLRQDIFWRLRRSRETAPLWNAQKFTREMEKAYQQMWDNYLKTD